MSTAARGEGAACAGLGGGAHAVTEPVGPEPVAETEREGCGSLQRMVRRFRLSEPERVNLEMAAKGCISGALSEWPIVLRGLKAAGCYVHLRMNSDAAREMAKLVLELEAMTMAHDDLSLGEYICGQCGLRKDSECDGTHDF